MSDPATIISEAIARGDATMGRVIGFRDQLFEPCMGILLHLGAEHTRACVAGVVEHVIIVLDRQARGLPPIDGEVLPFPPKIGAAG